MEWMLGEDALVCFFFEEQVVNRWWRDFQKCLRRDIHQVTELNHSVRRWHKVNLVSSVCRYGEIVSRTDSNRLAEEKGKTSRMLCTSVRVSHSRMSMEELSRSGQLDLRLAEFAEETVSHAKGVTLNVSNVNARRDCSHAEHDAHLRQLRLLVN